MTPEIAVIVPTFNERENISELAGRIFAAADREGLDIELLVVDDASPDGTAAAARREAEKYGGRLRVLERAGNRGLSESVVDGIRATQSTIIAVNSNRRAQRQDFDAVLCAARSVDACHGVSINQEVWKNIMKGNLTPIP